jgi:hypothetical protein
MKEEEETGKEKYLKHGQIIRRTGWLRRRPAKARGWGLAHLQILPKNVRIRVDGVKGALHADPTPLCLNEGEAVLGLKHEKRGLTRAKKLPAKPTLIA